MRSKAREEGEGRGRYARATGRRGGVWTGSSSGGGSGDVRLVLLGCFVDIATPGILLARAFPQAQRYRAG